VRGRHLVARAGIPVSASFRPGQSLTFSHLLHELTAARAAVVAKLTPGFGLTELRLAPSLARQPPTLTTTRNGKRRRIAVTPDCFAVLTRERDGQRFPTWIEIDRGSVPLGRIMEGLRMRLRLLADGGYTAWSGFQAVRVLYLTTAGSARRESLCRVAQEVIASEKLPEFAEFFFFTQAQYERLYEPCPHCASLPLYTHARWYKPGAAGASVAALEPSLCDAKEEHPHGDSRQRD